MDEAQARQGLEAAGRLAAMSPQTQSRMIEWDFDGLPPTLWVSSAFRTLGRAIASKRSPLADRDLKRLFQEIDRLLQSSDGQVSNAVATGLLEEIWRSVHESGFDFSTIDPHLGSAARSYLVRWDDFNGVRTPGLQRR